jgi:hypothetical protein
VEFTEKEDIKEGLLDENKQRFNQSKDTVFMTSPLCNLVNPMGFNEYSQNILEGTDGPGDPKDCFGPRDFPRG